MHQGLLRIWACSLLHLDVYELLCQKNLMLKQILNHNIMLAVVCFLLSLKESCCGLCHLWDMHDVSAKDTEWVLLLDRATQSQTGDCRFVSCAIFAEAIFAFRTDLYFYVSYKNICSQLQLLKTEKFTEEKYISLSGNAGEESSSSSGLNQRWIQSDLLPGNLRSWWYPSSRHSSAVDELHS